MTCIAAVADDGIVYMAGDRAMSDGNVIVTSQESKLFDTGQFLVGCAGNIGIAQALRYHYEWPPVVTEDHIHTILLPDLQGYLTSRFTLDPDDPCHILLGYEGQIYEISTAGWHCIAYGDMAIGSGKEFALGSLYSTEGDPKDRVIMAVMAAIDLSPGCTGPIDVLTM